jgi:hypothetical protein
MISLIFLNCNYSGYILQFFSLLRCWFNSTIVTKEEAFDFRRSSIIWVSAVSFSSLLLLAILLKIELIFPFFAKLLLYHSLVFFHFTNLIYKFIVNSKIFIIDLVTDFTASLWFLWIFIHKFFKMFDRMFVAFLL